MSSVTNRGYMFRRSASVAPSLNFRTINLTGIRVQRRLGKHRNRNRPLLGHRLTMQLDPLDFMQRFGCQITLATVWAANNGHVLNDEQAVPSSIAARDVANPGPLLTANIADQLVCL